MKAIWYVKGSGPAEGPLTLRDLIEGMSALEDWDGLQIRHARTGTWYPTAEIESRMSAPAGKRRWLSAAAWLVLGLIAGAGAVLAFTHPLQGSFQAMSDPQLRHRGALAAKLLEARDGLPKMIDRTTIRTGISYDDPVLTFTNIILLEAAAIPDATRADISRAVTANTCGFAQARTFMAAGGSFAFSYADNGARPLMTVAVSERNCF